MSKEKQQEDLFRRFELAARRVTELGSIVQNPGTVVTQAELEDWVDATDGFCNEFSELCIDVIRFMKGGPA